MDKPRWEDRTDEELEAELAAALEQPDAGGVLPTDVPALIEMLAALGWGELDTLVAVPDGVAPPNVKEWAGLALAAMPSTEQGRIRGKDFRKDIARIVAPGLSTAAACAMLKKAAEARQRAMAAAQSTM